jgi:hypothetical protein
MSIDHWKVLQFPPAEELEIARHQFHQAIQNVGCIGRSFLPTVPRRPECKFGVGFEVAKACWKMDSGR